ncbi:predicted protein [Postia placenta Mad-698-R]|nr:predicted protein [Postia placenta Mad-698-R]
MAARSPSPAPPGPLPIRRLQESVINRIAAGEIIHRPASALKELIENSLDAQSTSIRVTVKDGGMRLLQIQDNGCGIRKTDLPILAERFTTSKLSSFSDLAHIATYGFRGEALASISYVAHLMVVTKTKADACAWKAIYTDGALAPTKGATSAEPKATAGTDGTTITVWHNALARMSGKPVLQYSDASVSASQLFRRAGSSGPEVSTPSGSTTEQAIRLLYGQTIAKDLLHTTVSSQSADTTSDDEEDADGVPQSSSWSAEAHFTNAHYQAKKMVLLLFINHRLVDSPRIKKALENVYTGILPKVKSTKDMLSLQIDPRAVDVNVHPTKREVHFLDEDVIIERIADALQQKLVGQSQSRVFEYQTLLTGGIAEVQRDKGKGKERQIDLPMEGEDDSPMSAPSTQLKKKVLSQHKVRTSLTDRTLDSMFPVISPSQQPGSDAATGTTNRTAQEATPGTPRVREIKESECFLTSVRDLRQAVLKGRHRRLSEIVQKHTFVGIVDVNRCLSLLQHSTELYLVNHGALTEELFYQLGLRQFGDMSRFKLDPAPSVRTLVELAIDAEPGTERSSMSKSEIVERIVDTMMTRREMLREYFSLCITSDGLVQSLPMLLRDYTPNLDKLPLFLMRLGPQVDWTSEKECFETFLRELAYFYSEPKSDDDKAEQQAVKWQIQHVLFPAVAKYLVPPKSLLDRDVVQVASLPDLYRVFERC